MAISGVKVSVCSVCSVCSVFFSVGVLGIFWYRSLVSKRREVEESDLLTASFCLSFLSFLKSLIVVLLFCSYF